MLSIECSQGKWKNAVQTDVREDFYEVEIYLSGRVAGHSSIGGLVDCNSHASINWATLDDTWVLISFAIADNLSLITHIIHEQGRPMSVWRTKKRHRQCSIETKYRPTPHSYIHSNRLIQWRFRTGHDNRHFLHVCQPGQAKELEATRSNLSWILARTFLGIGLMKDEPHLLTCMPQNADKYNRPKFEK